MTSERDRREKADSLSELERATRKARQQEADAEREAEDTLGRAEELERKSEELGKAGDEIRRKASDPVGFPRPETRRRSRPDAGD